MSTDLCNAEVVVVGTVTGIAGSRWATSNGKIPPSETAQQAINSGLLAYNVLRLSAVKTLYVNPRGAGTHIAQYVEIDSQVGAIGIGGVQLTVGETDVMAVMSGTVVPVTPSIVAVTGGGVSDPSTGEVRAAFSVDGVGYVDFPTTGSSPTGRDIPGPPLLVPLSSLAARLSACPLT